MGVRATWVEVKRKNATAPGRVEHGVCGILQFTAVIVSTILITLIVSQGENYCFGTMKFSLKHVTTASPLYFGTTRLILVPVQLEDKI